MITFKRFKRLEAAIVAAGYGDSIAWSEKIALPRDAEEFAERAIYVICNSGIRTSVALLLHVRCMKALRRVGSAKMAFRHPGKTAAIDSIWATRSGLFAEMFEADDIIEFCRGLPWIGPVTCYHLAKNLGADVAKDDVHLRRLAEYEDVTTQQLCVRLAVASGYRVATVDTILWRACESGLLNSRTYLELGWTQAINMRR